jgi:TatD DNase family protein
MFVDTHCHVNMLVKNEPNIHLLLSDIQKIDAIMQECLANDVEKIINVGTNILESENCLMIARSHASMYATVGIHPNDIESEWKQHGRLIREWAQEREKLRIVAIGECGMDRHYPGSDIQKQADVFKMHIEIALEHGLALVIHSRDAYEETLRILEQYKNEDICGVMHCFSYDLAFARTVLDWGFLLGIGGPVTYPKNSVLRDVLKEVGIKNIVLETDTPFLPIQSMRGKKNHPRHIRDIAVYIADLCQCTFEEIARQTTENAAKLFGLFGG